MAGGGTVMDRAGEAYRAGPASASLILSYATVPKSALSATESGWLASDLYRSDRGRFLARYRQFYQVEPSAKKMRFWQKEWLRCPKRLKLCANVDVESILGGEDAIKYYRECASEFFDRHFESHGVHPPFSALEAWRRRWLRRQHVRLATWTPLTELMALLYQTLRYRPPTKAICIGVDAFITAVIKTSHILDLYDLLKIVSEYLGSSALDPVKLATKPIYQRYYERRQTCHTQALPIDASPQRAVPHVLESRVVVQHVDRVSDVLTDVDLTIVETWCTRCKKRIDNPRLSLSYFYPDLIGDPLCW